MNPAAIPGYYLPFVPSAGLTQWYLRRAADSGAHFAQTAGENTFDVSDDRYFMCAKTDSRWRGEDYSCGVRQSNPISLYECEELCRNVAPGHCGIIYPVCENYAP